MATTLENAKSNTKTSTVLELLQTAYTAELETVINYLAHSVNLEGVKAEEIKKALADDVGDELGHAQQLAQRIKQLYGHIPGSLDLRFSQQSLQPPERRTDLRSVILGVIDAENEAIDVYRRLIQECEGRDYVTQDLAVRLLADEEAHRTQFESFLAEFTD